MIIRYTITACYIVMSGQGRHRKPARAPLLKLQNAMVVKNAMPPVGSLVGWVEEPISKWARHRDPTAEL